MKELILFILASAGLTQVLCYGSILDWIRPKNGLVGKLFGCSMCMGFYVGIINYAFLSIAGFYLGHFNIVTVIIYGFISSYTSYALDKIIGDDGIKISTN